jgi:hypothetical protein
LAVNNKYCLNKTTITDASAEGASMGKKKSILGTVADIISALFSGTPESAGVPSHCPQCGREICDENPWLAYWGMCQYCFNEFMIMVIDF